MTPEELQRENEELRRQLAEAEEALAAIREGQVDAIVTEGAGGPQVFSLSGVETIYRIAVETMAEAAIYTTVEGTILFCNSRFTEFVAMPMENVLGREVAEFVPEEDRESMRALLDECTRRPVEQRVVFRGAGGVLTPVMLTGVAQTQDGSVTLCLVAADRTEPERQLDNLQRVNRLYAVLSRVNEAILRVHNEQELFDAACQIAVEDGGFILAWLGFVDRVTQQVHVTAKYGRDEDYLDEILISTDSSVPEGQGPTAVSLRECRPIINNDTARNPFMLPWRDAQLARGFKASASFPLAIDGDCIGVMTLYSDTPGVFDEEEVRLLTALADDFSFALQAGRRERERQEAVAALQRSRDELELRVEERTAEIQSLYEEQSTMTEELQTSLEEQEALTEQLSLSKDELERHFHTTSLLLEAANELNRWTDLDVLLNALANVTLRALEHERVYVGLLAEDRSRVTFASNVGKEPIPAGTVVPWEKLSSALREVLERGKTRTIDFETLPEGERGLASTTCSRLALLVPLVFGDRVLGHIAVDDPGECREFTEREIRIVEGIASQAAVAMENARLYRTEQARSGFGQSMVKINAELASSLDIDEALPLVLKSLSESIGATDAFIADRVSGGWRVRETGGTPRLSPGQFFADKDAVSANIVLATRRPLTLEDAIGDDRVNGAVAERLGYRGYAVYPLIVRDAVIGVLGIHYEEPHSFSEAELDYLGRVAFAISLSEETGRLYKAEHDIADRLQEALLALPDEVQGIEFAHAYHSASEAARVGGDFYDLFELNHDHVGVVVGDVAGKGLDAAVLTSMVKNTIRAHANERGKTPSQILTLTNDVIYKSTTTEAFVTVFFGILDCRDGRLVYSNAGHTTSAVVGADGSVGKLPATGPLLGAFEGASFEQAEAWLDTEQLLFLYTDGLTEARRDSELYGEDRLVQFLSSTRDGSAKAVVQAVIDDVISFSRARLRDDLAIMAVKQVQKGAETPQQQKLQM